MPQARKQHNSMTKTQAIIIAVFLFLILTAVFIYLHFMEFNNAAVNKYLAEDSKNFNPEDRPKVFKILQLSAKDVLTDPELRRQVRYVAKVTALPKEKVLADRAIAHAQSLKYIN